VPAEDERDRERESAHEREHGARSELSHAQPLFTFSP
jgi:hypothetical protein